MTKEEQIQELREKIANAGLYKLVEETEPDYKDNQKILESKGWRIRMDYGIDGYNQEHSGVPYWVRPDGSEVRALADSAPILTTKKVKTGKKVYVVLTPEEILSLIQQYTYLKAERELPQVPRYDNKGNNVRTPNQWKEAQQDMLKPDPEGRVWASVYKEW